MQKKKESDAAINSSWSGDNITMSHSPVRKVSSSMIVKKHLNSNKLGVLHKTSGGVVLVFFCCYFLN